MLISGCLWSKDIALLERDWDWPSDLKLFCGKSSKDIALLERDWDILNHFEFPQLTVERHRPARKGLRHYAVWYCRYSLVERHRPARKGLRRSPIFLFPWPLKSKDIALLERDWDFFSHYIAIFITMSKDIALLERDWDNAAIAHNTIVNVERHRPARKGLRRVKSLKVGVIARSKDIALLERDWDLNSSRNLTSDWKSKDIALLERDWDI